MSYGEELRTQIFDDEITVAPGVHDPLTARVAEAIGFESVGMTGNGTSLSKLGQPDVGLITLMEMVENAERIQDTVDIPLIADADNGYGNAINVTRTVHEYIKAGVAGIHIEDQVFPKRCGFVEGKQVISAEEAIGKFEAAADTRDEYDESFIIIARTDARGAPEGTLDEAIKRVNAYCQAGADVAFIQGPKDVSELERIGKAVDAPLIYNCSGGSPVISIDRAESLGFDIVMFPRISTLSTITALFDAYGALAEKGVDAWTDLQAEFDELPIESYDHFAGVPDILEKEERYLPDN
jgi:2-methylisocitrate lyase-like PEP mutase family enzyme